MSWTPCNDSILWLDDDWLDSGLSLENAWLDLIQLMYRMGHKMNLQLIITSVCGMMLKVINISLDKWIGRVSVTFPAPMKWPAGRSDLQNLMVVCGCMEDIASKQRYRSSDELKAGVTSPFGKTTAVKLTKMSHKTCPRIILCSETEGSTQINWI